MQNIKLLGDLILYYFFYAFYHLGILQFNYFVSFIEGLLKKGTCEKCGKKYYRFSSKVLKKCEKCETIKIVNKLRHSFKLSAITTHHETDREFRRSGFKYRYKEI